ncbi:type I restriction enzyme S subunit [Paraburkholderia sp. Clong3]|uniref:restriction endonuclease subunit S n=1 Tax=Paraburkholderia sp. Clong3 TaxID=2991061 RepID=UPI003D1D4D5D
MSNWPMVSLYEIVSQIDRAEPVKTDSKYRLLGVRLEGNGAFHRETLSGNETSATRLSRVEVGDFIYSRLFAWRGAFGIIGPELDGAFVSNEFPLFRVDDSQLDSRFLNRWFQLPATWKRVEEDCTGSTPTTRNRFKEAFFLKLEIPLPPLPEQRVIVAKLDDLSDKTTRINAHLDAVESEADRLLALSFRDAIASVPYRPMSEVAPLVRREVEIDAEARYPELGIRSFGKGTFHKPAVSGMELGTKRLFRIEPGDLLFSNVFAWEGAITIARPEDAWRFGSHRFMTCVVDSQKIEASFLLYYLLGNEGLEKVREASPGGAGRNRTLGVEKLARIEVPVPPMAAQRDFTTLQTAVTELKAKHAAIRQSSSAVVPAALERLFGAHRTPAAQYRRPEHPPGCAAIQASLCNDDLVVEAE